MAIFLIAIFGLLAKANELIAEEMYPVCQKTSLFSVKSLTFETTYFPPGQVFMVMPNLSGYFTANTEVSEFILYCIDEAGNQYTTNMTPASFYPVGQIVVVENFLGVGNYPRQNYVGGIKILSGGNVVDCISMTFGLWFGVN